MKTVNNLKIPNYPTSCRDYLITPFDNWFDRTLKEIAGAPFQYREPKRVIELSEIETIVNDAISNRDVSGDLVLPVTNILENIGKTVLQSNDFKDDYFKNLGIKRSKLNILLDLLNATIPELYGYNINISASIEEGIKLNALEWVANQLNRLAGIDVTKTQARHFLIPIYGQCLYCGKPFDAEQQRADFCPEEESNCIRKWKNLGDRFLDVLKQPSETLVAKKFIENCTKLYLHAQNIPYSIVYRPDKPARLIRGLKHNESKQFDE